MPREGLVLPNDIWRRRAPAEHEPETQHDRLVRALYEALIAAWVAGENNPVRFAQPKK